MQDYKRIVSYIHTYENNEKKRNIGFAKLEARGRLGRLAILLNGLNMLEGRKIAVYFLNIADYQEGIQVGECRVDKGRVAAELRFDTESIADSNMNLEQMHGLYFMTEEEPYAVFASSWTDERIIPDKFRVRGKENAVDNAEESIGSNTGYNTEDNMRDGIEANSGYNAQDSTGDNVQDRIEVSAGADTQDSAGDNAQGRIEVSAGVNAQDSAGNNVRDSIETNAGDNTQDSAGNNTEGNAQDSAEQAVLHAAVIEAAPKGTGDDETFKAFLEALRNMDSASEAEEAAVRDNGMTEDMLSQMELELQTKSPWEELCSRYPKVIAFEGEPCRLCLKIDLKDLENICETGRDIGGNGFLLRAYYRYRYFLLIENEKDSEGRSCILGIPGIYCRNEVVLAKVSGFEEFCLSKPAEHMNGRFGYWFKVLKL